MTIEQFIVASSHMQSSFNSAIWAADITALPLIERITIHANLDLVNHMPSDVLDRLEIKDCLGRCVAIQVPKI
jgi:hypothetical protein